jgi:hypothetical protein
MTTGKILQVARKSRCDSQATVGHITGYSRQHIAACEKDIKCFSAYPEIVDYVLTVTQQNTNSEDILRDWLNEANESDKRLRKIVGKLARCILDEVEG